MKTIEIPAAITLVMVDQKGDKVSAPKPFPFEDFVCDRLLAHDMFGSGRKNIYAGQALAESVIEATAKGSKWWTIDEAHHKMLIEAADTLGLTPATNARQLVTYYRAIDNAFEGLPKAEPIEAAPSTDTPGESQGKSDDAR